MWMAGLAVGLAVSFGLCGCDSGGSDDGDDDGTTPPPGVVNAQVAGVWHGTRANGSGSSACTLTLTQSGGSLGGNYTDNSLFSGPVSGSINGDDIDIVVTMSGTPVPHPEGETWTIKGAVNATETKIVATMVDVTHSLTFTLKVTK
jgi:hypothetical protein